MFTSTRPVAFTGEILIEIISSNPSMMFTAVAFTLASHLGIVTVELISVEVPFLST